MTRIILFIISIILFTMQPSYAFKEADDTDLSEYNEEIFEESTCISKGLPRIVRQPSSVQAKVGEFVNFSVLSDACSATYQWKKNGVDITDAIQKSYTIDVAVPSDSGSYTVVVKNSNGSMISDPARLEIVNEKHAFEFGPVGKVVNFYTLSYPISCNGPIFTSKRADSYFTHILLEFGVLLQDNLCGISTDLLDIFCPVPTDYFFIDSTHKILPSRTFVTSYLPINLYIGLFDYKNKTPINTLIYLYSKFNWNLLLALGEGNQLLGTRSGKMSIDYGIGLQSYFFGFKLGNQFFYNGSKPDTVANKYTTPVSIKNLKRTGTFNRFYFSFSVNIGAVIIDLNDNHIYPGIILRPIFLPIEWGVTRSVNTIRSYNKFVDKYPRSSLVAKANKHIIRLMWNNASQSNDVELLKDFAELPYYMRTYDAEFVKPRMDSAKMKINRIEWDSACNKNTLHAYYEYFENTWPNIYYDSCNLKIDSILLAQISGGLNIESDYLQKAVEKYKKDKNIQGIKKIAEAFYTRGDLESAAHYFEKIRDTDGINKIANTYYSTGAYEDALGYYDKVNDMDGIDKTVNKLIDRGNYEIAVTYYEKKEDINGVKRIADALFDKGDYETAARYYKNLEDKDGLKRAADALFDKGDYEIAAKYYQYFKDDYGKKRTADALFNYGDYEEAGIYYEEISDQKGITKVAKALYDKGIMVFSGETKCGKMQVSVAFMYHMSNSSITNLVVNHTFVGGGGRMQWIPENAFIRVDGSGNINFQDNAGNFIKGRMISTTHASGTVGSYGPKVSLITNNNSYRKPCTEWNAYLPKF